MDLSIDCESRVCNCKYKSLVSRYHLNYFPTSRMVPWELFYKKKEFCMFMVKLNKMEKKIIIIFWLVSLQTFRNLASYWAIRQLGVIWYFLRNGS